MTLFQLPSVLALSQYSWAGNDNGGTLRLYLSSSSGWFIKHWLTSMPVLSVVLEFCTVAVAYISISGSSLRVGVVHHIFSQLYKDIGA